jgi:hypothetical protein
MSAVIDFRTLPQNVPVMCIPRVFPNIDEKRIRHIFDELKLGQIDHIDIIGKTTEKGEKFNRVFIHFRNWFSNPNADTARERLINGKEIKIIYDEPWFWKISAYREQQPRPQQPRPQQQQHRKAPPTLQFDDEEPAARPVVDEFGRDIRQQQPRPQQQQRPQNQRPQQQRPQNQRPNQHQQQRPNQQRPAIAIAPALAPPAQPSLQELTESGPFNIECESVPIPVKKRTIAKKQKPLKVLEEGEVEEI